MSLVTDAQARKEQPIYSGVIKYFPDALAKVAGLSFVGNEKHNKGEPLHWSKGKSNDHLDCLMRHLADVGEYDAENKCDHAVAVAWRALANLQTMIEENTLATPASRIGTVTDNMITRAVIDREAMMP